MNAKKAGKIDSHQSVRCFLCGSINTASVDYLRLNSGDFKRNLAYFLPKAVADTLCAVSSRFALAYHPVAVNKKYFQRSAVYCKDCLTGSCQPGFEKELLTDYYKKFYWNNRDAIDGQHISLEDRPNDRQMGLAEERIAWIDQFLPPIESVIDFGAGDCAAAFIFSKRAGVHSVHVVDPSFRAGALAAQYGAGYSETVEHAPVVDLVYSAHSIEHVPDLLMSMDELLKMVPVGGFLFFETPNIGDLEIFETLCHTPHTFMLSANSFHFLQKVLPIKIIAIECCGPTWKKSRKQIRSTEKTDLRVLLQKTSDA